MLVTQRLLTPNQWSRPGTPMTELRGIAIHWVENPGTSAEFNRRWFEMRKTGGHGYGSAHFIIDESEIIQCIPETEMGYHVGPKSKATDLAKDRFAPYANEFLIGIELCHPDATGEFTPKVLIQCASVAAILCLRHGWDPQVDVLRHHDITGKNCPLWFVENEGEWADFRNAIDEVMGLYG